MPRLSLAPLAKGLLGSARAVTVCSMDPETSAVIIKPHPGQVPQEEAHDTIRLRDLGILTVGFALCCSVNFSPPVEKGEDSN